MMVKSRKRTYCGVEAYFYFNKKDNRKRSWGRFEFLEMIYFNSILNVLIICQHIGNGYLEMK